MRLFKSRRGVAPTAVTLTVTVLLSLAIILTGPGTSALGAAPSGTNYGAPYIQIGEAASRSIPPVVGPTSSTPAYVPDGLLTSVAWVAEAATVPDRTTNPTVNRITPRTAAMVDAAISAKLTRLGAVTCVAERSSNPTSDHPAGRGCDLMFDPRSAAGVSAGWLAADWLVANQAALGVKYVIFQGQIWNARSRPGPWTEYVSTAYGCPNPANITGCHYDHVHVSMY